MAVRVASSYDPVKRTLDILGAVIGLVLLLPVIALTAVCVAIDVGRPVIFAQPRPGRHGRIFTLYKFRSMRSVDDRHRLVTDAQRVTKFGRVLRGSSLDELPSLWNVLRGEMSVVGPRPLLVEYLDRYTPEQARRHEVRPGLTGLAQVAGRNTVSWERRFALDVAYVDARSLRLDARILARTVGLVLRREGIAAPGSVSAHTFEGTGHA
ncbi:UDP-galactose phosphate transferase [Microbacterium sp. UMB0228]|nr:UDP-galactose phosphate transferase [Microbacterium sp. UMB0228]